MEQGHTSFKSNEYLNRLEVDGEEEYIDHWDTGELLFLTSLVLRSDRNWVSVTRSIKPFGEHTRPADWYTPKNCALQYTKLLNEIEEETKKKTLPRIERETPEVVLIKNLTDKRLNELAWLNQQTKVTSNVLKTYIEMVESGDFDENLDELVKQIEEKEKSEEENYNDYLQKRETLIATKRLNKSRIAKAKAAVAKVLESKKKMPAYSEAQEEPSHQTTSLQSFQESVKAIKQEPDSEEEGPSLKHIPVKAEIDTPITLNALLDSKVTIPSSVAPTSPLLTSLLRSIGSTTPSSHTLSSVSSHLKEVKTESLPPAPTTSTSSESSHKIDVFLSPSKIPPAGISPLLTSLLKSTTLPPSSHCSSMATSHSKEADPSEIIESIKLDLEAAGKAREISPRSSIPQSPRPTPASSPLLNSLLKNSPSSTTPLQMSPVKDISPKAVSSPQPFFNPNSILATAAAQQIALATSTHPQVLFQHQDSTENRKVGLQTSPVTSACLSAPTLSKLLEMPPSTPGRLPLLLDTSQTIPTVSVAVDTALTSPQKSSGIPQTPTMDVKTSPSFLKKTPTKSIVQDTASFPVDTTVLQKSLASYSQLDKKASIVEEVVTKEEVDKADFKFVKAELESIPIENLDILDAVTASINQAFETKDINKKDIDEDADRKDIVEFSISHLSSPQMSSLRVDNVAMEEEVSSYSIVDDIAEAIFAEDSGLPSEPDSTIAALPPGPARGAEGAASADAEKDDKSLAGRKFYKSRAGGKKEEDKPESIPLFQSPKKVPAILEVESPTPSSNVLTTSAHTTPPDNEKQELKPGRRSDSKSPVAKKPRMSEKSPEKVELSEDDARMVAVRRSGRRGKKGRGRIARNTPAKQAESRDQYEFTESTEDNSLGYQVQANTLCYMPRVKDEENKVKDSEDTTSTASSPVEKKPITPTRAKQGRGGSHGNVARKALFTSDEERMSDSMTSDDASNPLLSEDKLKKWDDSCDKKGDIAKATSEIVKITPKTPEASKKKFPPVRKIASAKTIPIPTERKSNPDMEELSVGSRDSEENSVHGKDSGIKDPSVDMEVETNDSHPSESDKPDDPEESLPGSVFSPPPQVDWLTGHSPKSFEAHSHSEESEGYESDNWDNHSASTNKSTTHPAGVQPRMRRKERESPKYKAWKKAISIVWREAACHKNANIFSSKVTNDLAPGYLNIVHRPMDLSLIKRNIDSGAIRTTNQFHRDMLLMFQNAIMYNNADHDVHQMALEMQRDVMQQISAFLDTQPSDTEEENEPVSTLRGARKKGLGKESTRASSSKSKEETD